jgi:hypothetical protein
MIDNFPEVLNFNRLFLKPNQLICKYPVRCIFTTLSMEVSYLIQCKRKELIRNTKVQFSKQSFPPIELHHKTLEVMFTCKVNTQSSDDTHNYPHEVWNWVELLHESLIQSNSTPKPCTIFVSNSRIDFMKVSFMLYTSLKPPPPPPAN